MKISPLVASALASVLAAPVSAFVRMNCGSRLVDERIDPIVNPGTPSGQYVNAPHVTLFGFFDTVHSIHGANGFNFTQPDGLIKRSTCTTCQIKEDLSVYWTPKLYYHNFTDDTYTAVPQSGDGGSRIGGMTVYYLQRGGPNNDNLTAFPEGFRMISGDPFKRNYTGDFAAQAISFACLDYNNPGPETNYLPNKNCPQGYSSTPYILSCLADVFFPSCWSGKELDSPDHKSHVSFPAKGSYNGGSCPSTHPVHMVSLFYEVLYSTDQFQWTGDKQPFVFANGDPTGYGLHADFLSGWSVPTLQNMIDKCTDASGQPEKCDQITLLSDNSQQTCKIPPQINEDVIGPMKQLPGCNPLTYGPARASPVSPCNRTGVIGDYQTYGSDLTASGYKYLGCAPDSVNNRTFTGARQANNNMTLENCISFCQSKGFSLAGTEYSTECYCSNTIPANATPLVSGQGACNMPCKANPKQICGGGNGLSVYQKCTDGSPCVNAKYSPVT